MNNEIATSEPGRGDAPPPYKAKLSSVSVKSQPHFQQNNQGGEPFVQDGQEKRNWDDECCPGCSKKCCIISGVIMSLIGLILVLLVIFGALWFRSAFTSHGSDKEQSPADDGLMCTCNTKSSSNSGISQCKPSQTTSSSDGAGDGEMNCANLGFCLWEEGKDGKKKRDCGRSDPRHEYGCLKIDGVTRCLCDCPRCNMEKPYDDQCWGTDCSKDESHANSSSTNTSTISSPSTGSSTERPNKRPPKSCDSDASHHFPLLPLPCLIISVVFLEHGVKYILLIFYIRPGLSC